jgi:hypothetical protein
VFLAAELGCEFESRDENGIRFIARGTKLGTLQVAEESLEDRERPEYLIQLLLTRRPHSIILPRRGSRRYRRVRVDRAQQRTGNVDSDAVTPVRP